MPLAEVSRLHRDLLDRLVRETVGATAVRWLDFGFNASRIWPDAESKGIDFLNGNALVRVAWSKFWPQTGEPPNWDAIASVVMAGGDEWLLVEAKANVSEMKSECKAKVRGGRPQIEKAFEDTKKRLGVPEDRDWMKSYYQFSNRIAVLHFLNENGIPARLLNVYFTGDKSGRPRSCPRTRAEWEPWLEARHQHLGLPRKHKLSDRIHDLFLDVCPQM